MSILSKDLILSAGNRREKVDIPEWGGHVYITTVSAADWMSVQDEARKDGEKQGTAEWMGRLLVRTVVDEDGQRLFDDSDIPGLMQKSLAAINRLFKVADELNDFSGRGLRDAEKNSNAGDGDDSSIPSREN